MSASASELSPNPGLDSAGGYPGGLDPEMLYQLPLADLLALVGHDPMARARATAAAALVIEAVQSTSPSAVFAHAAETPTVPVALTETEAAEAGLRNCLQYASIVFGHEIKPEHGPYLRDFLVTDLLPAYATLQKGKRPKPSITLPELRAHFDGMSDEMIQQTLERPNSLAISTRRTNSIYTLRAAYSTQQLDALLTTYVNAQRRAFRNPLPS